MIVNLNNNIPLQNQYKFEFAKVENDELFYKLLDENIMKVKLHIGNGGINISTWVGMWNEIFKNFREYNIEN